MQRRRQQMRVSEDNIGRVQGIGLDEIGRELVIGNFPNIPIYETTRAEALERGWERGREIQEVDVRVAKRKVFNMLSGLCWQQLRP